jgi:serine/threonine protein kinase
MPDLIGQTLGRYRIIERIGEGGMAEVYKALDTILGRHVAIKVILPHHEHSERFLKRFEQEARLLAKLSHPNVLKVFDFGEFDGAPYLVMEYISGGTLKQRMKGNRYSWQDTLRLLTPVARALQSAHAEHVIHRDVKPSNILLANEREPMLSDFGIARLIQDDEATADLTGTGVLGTPEYMAPEQGYGRADEKSDIYALGVVFYEMVTGRKPYQADTPMGVMLKKNTEPLPPPTRFVRDLPPFVENVLIKALARAPEQRYPTMMAFANALEELANPDAEETEIILDIPFVKRGMKKGRRDWIPWAAGVLLVVCCMIAASVMAWPLIFPAGTDTPSPVTSVTKMPLSPIPTVTKTLPPVATTMVGNDGVSLVYVPEGEFRMGSNDGNERPVHTVYLDAFWIDQYEVTNAAYAKCVDSGKCRKPVDTSASQRPSYYGNSKFDNYPVVNVNWYMARDYCQWAGRRLPTEAEWEKAARGDKDAHTYPWGDGINCDYANFYGCAGGVTTEVGTYEKGKSPYGVYDMIGNAFEWVADWYSETYYENSPYRNPLGPDSGKWRVLRGGSWDRPPNLVYSTSREWSDPSMKTTLAFVAPAMQPHKEAGIV